jgi:hypothetical protein
MTLYFESQGTTVFGVTSLDNELYVLREYRHKDQVDVYSQTTNSLLQQLTVRGLEVTLDSDMTSCKHNRCLYISDENHDCVHRVELPD